MKKSPFARPVSAFLAAAALAASACFPMAAEGRSLDAPSSPSEIWDVPSYERSTKRADPVWAAIRAKMVDPDTPLRLSSLVDIALENNPTTKQAWERAKAAYAKQAQALSALYPKVTGTFDVRQDRTIPNAKVNSVNAVRYGPAAELDYLLVDFGGRTATIRGANLDLLAANFLFNKAFQDLILSVAQSYYALYAAQANVVATKADVDNAKAILDAAEKKLDAGLVSKLDVYQAESTYYNKVYSLEAAKGDLKTARAALALAIGLSADTDFRIAKPPSMPRTTLSKQEISELIDRGLRQRPDIASARSTLYAKNEAVAVANSAMYPQLTFQSSVAGNDYYYGNNGYNPATAGKAWGDDLAYSYYGFKVSWDMFDGYDNYNKKMQAKAEFRAECAKLYETELKASSDVWSKFYAFRANIRKHAASRAYLKAATGSYDLALEGYRAGLKSMLDLTQAEDDLSNARSKLIQSERDLYVSAVQLIHAIGELYPGSASVAENY